MKDRGVIRRQLVRAVSVVIFLVVGVLASAYMSDELDLGWYTVDGGGGVCSSDELTLVCSIGQPDAGAMTGGGYTLESGFLVGESSGDLPPVITILLSSDVLWPPNHKMVHVLVSVTAGDDNDPDPSYWLERISVVEDDMSYVYNVTTGQQSGQMDMAGDIEVDGDGRIYLRAERSGTHKDGRTYTITYAAEDSSGNIAEESVTLKVPHSMGKKQRNARQLVP